MNVNLPCIICLNFLFVFLLSLYLYIYTKTLFIRCSFIRNSGRIPEEKNEIVTRKIQFSWLFGEPVWMYCFDSLDYTRLCATKVVTRLPVHRSPARQTTLVLLFTALLGVFQNKYSVFFSFYVCILHGCTEMSYKLLLYLIQYFYC